MPALLALLAALGQLPVAPLAAQGERAEVNADQGELDTVTHVARAEGHVVLKSGGVRLLADELAYDTETRAGTAGGNLLMIDGGVAVRAREAAFSLAGDQALVMESVELWQKGPEAVAALLALTNPALARTTGKNQVLLKAEYLERMSKGRYWARKMRMTSCDCSGDAAPDWSIWAWRADVEPGERAILYFPAMMAKDVPFLPLPILYLPLSPRRSGFLFPRFNYLGTSGFTIDEPYFLTLGDSYDLTVSLGYRFGIDPIQNWSASFSKGSAVPSLSESWSRTGTKGVRGTLDFRYVPAPKTTGELFISAIDDQEADPDPKTGNQMLRPPRGWRGELTWKHSSELPYGFAANADVDLVRDANYPSDEALNPFMQLVAYLHSQAWVGWHNELAATSVATGWYQDLSARFAPTDPECVLFGTDPTGNKAPVSLQRPFFLNASVPRLKLLGPLEAGMEVVAARYQPISILESLAPASPLGPEWLLGLTRLDVAPEIAWPFLTGGPVSAEAYLRARGDLASYSGLPQDETELRGRVIAGAWAGTELSRTFLDGTLKHTIEPRLEVRAATPRYGNALLLPASSVVSGQPIAPLDEFDERRESYAQGVASLTSQLIRKGKGSLLSLQVGQDLDLKAAQAADSFGSLEFSPGYVTLSGIGRWDWGRRSVDQVSAYARVKDGRGDMLLLSFDRLLGGGTDRMRASLDELFGPRVSPSDVLGTSSLGNSVMNQLGATLSVVPYEYISLSYMVALNPDAVASDGSAIPFIQKIQLHKVDISLSTACKCWKLDLGGVFIPGQGPRLTFMLDLQNVGSFGH